MSDRHTEFTWTTHDGLSMFAQHWIPDSGSADVLIVMAHGFSGHSSRFHGFAERFVEHGFAVVAFDHRGHGRSAGKPGHVPSFASVVGDLAVFVELAAQRYMPVRVVLYGHSMGGNAVANYVIQRQPENISGVILSAPWLELAFDPPVWKTWLARIFVHLLPSITLSSGIDPAKICRDRDFLQFRKSDPFNHERISSTLFLGAVESGRIALRNAARLNCPTLVLHGTADEITSHRASSEMAKLAPDAQLKLYTGLLHELHHEPERWQVFSDVVRWLQSL